MTVARGFVTQTAFKKHLDGDWRTVHELWSHIRNYMTSYAQPGGFIQGSVAFAGSGGFLTGDNSAFFWDATNDRLGLTQTTPTARIDIVAEAGNPGINISAGAAGEMSTPDGEEFRWGHWDAGTTTFTERLRFDAAGVFFVSYLTTGSVIFAGANGEIKQDNANFKWSNNRLGIGTTPSNALHVSSVGVTAGGTSYGGVVVRFNCTEDKHTSVSIDANTGKDPVLSFAENGSGIWDLRNDASATDKFQIRYQVGEVNRTDFQIDNAGNVEILTGYLGIKSSNELRFYDNGNHVGFEAPALDADQIWVLPAVDGAANEVLGTDGGGALIWRDHGELAGLGDKDHKLNEIANPDGNVLFTMTTRQIRFVYTNPAVGDGAFEIEASGAFSGDLVHIHQHTGNPGAVDLVHLECDDADVVPLRIDFPATGTPMVITNFFSEDHVTDHNLFFGYLAGASIDAGGQRNLFLGEGAGNAITTADNNVFMGYYAGNLCTAGNNVAIGGYAGRVMTGAGANSNALLGYAAGYTLTSGGANMYLGTSAGFTNSTGSSNVAIGTSAGYAHTGNFGVYIGTRAGVAVTSGGSIFIGFESGKKLTTGSNCIVIGPSAMGNCGIAALENLVIGNSAGYDLTGIRNIIMGSLAGYEYTSANYNLTLGWFADWRNVTGDNNVILGAKAAYGVALQSHSNNVIIGYEAGYSISTGTGNIIIGYLCARTQVVAGNNQLWIANTDTATPLIYGEFPNTLLQITAALHVGRDGATVGALTLWDGAGGNTPGYMKIHSPDGTAWYVFIEDDGTVKIHNGVPTANADGDAIGDQID